MLRAIIDIGSGSIGLALADFSSARAPVIKYQSRRDINTSDVGRLLERSLSVIDGLIHESQRAGLGAPEDVHCFLSPHLVATQLGSFDATYDPPVKINEAIVAELVKREVGAPSFGTSVEQKVMRVRLNGYDISRADNKAASRLEVSTFHTTSSPNVLAGLKRVIAGAYHNNNIFFHSFSFALFSVLRDLYGHEHGDFTFLDVGTGITDVGVVRDGALEQLSSFPWGRGSVADSPLADSLIRGFASGAVSDDARSAFVKKLRPLLADWPAATEPLMSKRVFILADGDIAGVFKKMFSGRGREVRELTTADVNKFYHNKSHVADDIFLAIAVIFVGKV